MAKKLEFDLALDVDTQKPNELADALEKIKDQAKSLGETDLSSGAKTLEQMRERLKISDQLLRNQQQISREKATEAFKLQQQFKTEEGRGQMAAQVIREQRVAGVDISQLSGGQVDELVKAKMASARMGARGAADVLAGARIERQEAGAVFQGAQSDFKDRLREDQTKRDQQYGLRRRIAGTAIGTAAGVGAALGARSLMGFFMQGLEQAENLERVMIMLEKRSKIVGDGMLDWTKSLGLTNRELGGILNQISLVGGLPGGSGRGQERFGAALVQGVQNIFGMEPGQAAQFAPGFRAGGIRREAGVLDFFRRSAILGGEDRAQLGLGALSLSDLMGQKLVTSNIPGALNAIEIIRRGLGSERIIDVFNKEGIKTGQEKIFEKMDPMRATRIAMSFGQGISSPDKFRNSFMLRALGFQGGSLDEYVGLQQRLEEGASGRNISAALKRAEIESGGSAGHMTVLLKQMGLSWDQAGTMVSRHLTGQMSTPADIQKALDDAKEKDPKIPGEDRPPVTELGKARKNIQDLSAAIGKLATFLAGPILKKISGFADELEKRTKAMQGAGRKGFFGTIGALIAPEMAERSELDVEFGRREALTSRNPFVRDISKEYNLGSRKSVDQFNLETIEGLRRIANIKDPTEQMRSPTVAMNAPGGGLTGITINLPAGFTRWEALANTLEEIKADFKFVPEERKMLENRHGAEVRTKEIGSPQ